MSGGAAMDLDMNLFWMRMCGKSLASLWES